MDGVQRPQGYSHFKEAVYFLPFSSQKFLVLILSTSEGWKAELTLEPPSCFFPILFNGIVIDWFEKTAYYKVKQIVLEVAKWLRGCILDIGGHSHHSTKLFRSHKHCYDGQWPLTSRYLKHCVDTAFKKFITDYDKNIKNFLQANWSRGWLYKKFHSEVNFSILLER